MLQSLRATPFNLVKGNSVQVKIMAVNAYGNSFLSTAGNGALIQLVPDAPVLSNDPLVTSDTVIRLNWSVVSDGGTTVIDYAVYYNQGTNNFVLLKNDVTTQYYQTDFVLVAGQTYKFKVSARNSVGTSLDSLELSILAAKRPDAPINLANVPEVTTAYQVGLSWQDGAYNGASPVIDY